MKIIKPNRYNLASVGEQKAPHSDDLKDQTKRAPAKRLDPVKALVNVAADHDSGVKRAMKQLNARTPRRKSALEIALQQHRSVEKFVSQVDSADQIKSHSKSVIQAIAEIGESQKLLRKHIGSVPEISDVDSVHKLLTHQKAGVLAAPDVTAVERAVTRHRSTALAAAQLSTAEQVLRALSTSSLSNTDRIRHNLENLTKANEIVSLTVAERAHAYAASTRDEFAQRAAKASRHLSGTESSAMLGVPNAKKRRG